RHTANQIPLPRGEQHEGAPKDVDAAIIRGICRGLRRAGKFVVPKLPRDKDTSQTAPAQIIEARVAGDAEKPRLEFLIVCQAWQPQEHFVKDRLTKVVYGLASSNTCPYQNSPARL